MWFFSKKDNNAERIKKVAIFASFSLKSILEPYIEYYLENLKKNFDTVILVTNNRELDKSVFTFLSGMNIELFQVTNEGFDFGMWQKVLFALNPIKI